MTRKIALAAPVKPVTSSYKRIALLGAFCAAVGAYFWLKSRYPALDMKSLMGDRTGTLGISFDVVLAPAAGDALLTRILKATVNWCYTNWKGMTFAVIFGGGTLALFNQIRFRGFRSPWLNAALGMIYGAPLGVCANCAAPVSKALYQGGYATETTLAALFASPTLNFVVLGMLFEFLPAPMAWTKLGLTFFLILAGVPLLTRLTRASRARGSSNDAGSAATNDAASGPLCDFTALTYVSESWLSALRGAAGALGHSFAYIFVTTVPFMFLAGFLGSALVEILPMNAIAQWPVTIWGLAAAALIGTFLPVPMSFDVIIVTILMEGGLNTAYAMVLLCTLGVFSIYPFLILWRTISWRLAAAAFATIAVLGAAGAGLTETVFEHQFKDNLARMEAAWSQGLASIQPELDSTLDETCRRLPESEAPRCLSQVAQNLKSSLPCEGIRDEETLQECKISGLAGLYLEHIEDCSRFGKEKYVRMCQEIAFNGFVNGKAPPGRKELQTYCSDVRSPHLLRLCEEAELQIRAQRRTDLTACATLESPSSATNCFKRIISRGFFGEETAENTVKTCDQLGNSRSITMCRTLFVRYSDLETSERICDQSAPEFRKACAVEVAKKTAARSASPERCLEASPDLEERAECLATLATRQLNKRIMANNIQEIHSILGERDGQGAATESAKSAAFERQQALSLKPESRGPGIISFPHVEHSVAGAKASETPFSRQEGPELGLVLPENVPSDFRHHATVGRGVAAGDFDRDGWIDLLFATREGPILYRNLGKLRFQREPVQLQAPAPGAQDLNAAALIDINGDGWLDLFCASRAGAAYFALSDKGSFARAKVVPLPDRYSRFVTRAAAFADVDRDGSLDVFIGNWAGGYAPYVFESATNELYLNRSMKFVEGPYTDTVRSTTLAALFTDVNQDGMPDLFVGNDFAPADQILLGRREGGFRQITPQDRIFAATPKHTMSYDSADIDNDLRLDVYATDITFAHGAARPYCSFITGEKERADCEQTLQAADAVDTAYISNCHELKTSAKRLDCATSILRQMASRARQERLCDSIPDYSAATRWSCLSRFRTVATQGSPILHLPQVPRNVLWMQRPDGSFEDRAKELGVNDTAWGWAGKFADLDNDGWQDLYVAAGGNNLKAVRTNFLFWNRGGKKFTDKRASESESGLRERFVSSSFVYADLDRDGDLDIVSNAVNAPLRIYLNQARLNQAGRAGSGLAGSGGANSISFELRSRSRNTHGIGARAIVTYGGGKKQLRELKAGGGYLSYDPPELHFGLGEATEIERLDVIWPDGKRTEIVEALPAGHHYVIEESGSALARR